MGELGSDPKFLKFKRFVMPDVENREKYAYAGLNNLLQGPTFPLTGKYERYYIENYNPGVELPDSSTTLEMNFECLDVVSFSQEYNYEKNCRLAPITGPY